MIVDAGFLVSVDRGERSAQLFLSAAHRSRRSLHTTEPVVAQVWRSGSRQARLAKLLSTIAVHPLDDGRTVGRLLAHTGTADVVDAHLVMMAARFGAAIVTGDVNDIEAVAASLGPAAPDVHPWPPS